MTIYVHPDTQRIARALMQAPPHALLLSGPHGIGLSGLWRQYFVAPNEQCIEVLPEKDEKVDTEKGTITVAAIRRLYDMLKTIHPKGRLVVIDYAERMGVPAQNAFLKLLEEPSDGTRFLLVTHSPHTLLPTIRSRTQYVDARPISLEQSNALLDELKVVDPVRRTQVLFIAKGLPAEIHRLVENQEYFSQRADIVKDARMLITGTPYTRLLLAKKYKDNREMALRLLSDSMKQVQQTLTKGGAPDSIHILNRLEAIHKRLTEQGNIRLQLSSLVMLQYK